MVNQNVDKGWQKLLIFENISSNKFTIVENIVTMFSNAHYFEIGIKAIDHSAYNIPKMNYLLFLVTVLLS